MRLHVGPPLPEYDRLKVLLRIFYIIPAYLIVYVMNIVIELAAIASWLVIVVTGKQPKGLQDVIGLCVSYIRPRVRAVPAADRDLPPFTDDHARQIGEPRDSRAAATRSVACRAGGDRRLRPARRAADRRRRRRAAAGRLRLA